MAALVAACSGGSDGGGSGGDEDASPTTTEGTPESPFERIGAPALLPPDPTSSIETLRAPEHGFGWLAAGSVLEPAGGSNAMVWGSPDGRSWSPVALVGADDAAAWGLASRDGLAMAFGRSGGGDGADAGIWLSEDGDEWSAVEADALGGDGRQQAFDGAMTADAMVVIGSEQLDDSAAPVVWASRDGRSWARAEVPVEEGDAFAAVAAGPSGFVVAGRGDDDGVVWVSADGARWRRVADPAMGGAGTQAVYDVAAGPTGFVAVGTYTSEGAASAPASWTSADGSTWSAPSGALPQPDDGRFSTRALLPASVERVGEGWLAAGGSDFRPAVWRSSDGLTWSPLPSFRELPGLGSETLITAMAATADEVMLALEGPVLLSAAGDAWSEVSVDASAFPRGTASALWLNALAEVDGTVVAVGGSERAPGGGRTGGQRSFAVRGANGDWAVTEVQSDRGALNGVAAAGDGLVAVGGESFDLTLGRSNDPNPDGIVRTSTDGSSFSAFGGTTPAEVEQSMVNAMAIGGQGTQELSGVAPLQDGWIAVGSTTVQGNLTPLVVRYDGSRIAREDVRVMGGGPGSSETRPQGACSSADGTVLVPGHQMQRDVEARLWQRAPDGAWASLDLGAHEVDHDRALASCAFATDAKAAIAVGTSTRGDSDVLALVSEDGTSWRSLSADDFGTTGDQRATAATGLPGGGWLVVGSEARQGQTDAMAWVVSPAGDVRRVPNAGSFGGEGGQAAYDVLVVGDDVIVAGIDRHRAGLWRASVAELTGDS